MPSSSAKIIDLRILTRGLGRTLFISVLCFSLIPLIFTGWISNQKTRESLYNKEITAFEVALQMRTFNLNSFFQERSNDLKLLANDENNIDLLLKIETAFGSSHQQLESFINSYEYVRLSYRFSGDPQAFIDISGDRDLLLVDMEGNILYSAATETDLGTNLGNESLRDTELAKVFRNALETGLPVFSDIAKYQPSENQEIIFGANMMVDKNGEKIGVLILKIGLLELNNMINDSTGLGETGQIFLIGTDGTLRSNLRNDSTKKILVDRIDNTMVSDWLVDEKLHHQLNPSDDGSPNYNKGVYVGDSDKEIITIARNLYNLEKIGIHWLAVAEIQSEEVYRTAIEVWRTTIFIFLVAAGLVVLLAMLLTRNIVWPISRLTKWAKQVSGGDLSIHNISAPTNEIGILNDAMKNMVYSLQKMNNERDEQDWLVTGFSQISELMQGEQNLTNLGRSVLSSLATYLDLQVGAIYVADGDRLLLRAGYAHKSSEDSFKWGEGIVGQVALEKKTICLSDVPATHLNMDINSGLAVSASYTIVVVPLLHEGEVQGVIEFGTFHAISERSIALIEKASSAIAIAIHSAVSREKLAFLLEQSQTQTEELASQQEELRHTNDSLEQQTKTLKASEENLQAQQEELRQTNEELKEQTQLLEEQKTALNIKNIELDNTRKAVEQKAEEVATASRYKSEFLANMSHELRTPLNSILLLSKHLSVNKDENMTDKQVECAATVHSSGTELLNLINEILDLAKVESGKMTIQPDYCYISDIASSMENNFRPIVDSRGVEFIVKIAPDMPKSFRTDCQRLSQIIKNLLSNAFKFTEKGSVTLDISMQTGKLPVTVSVSDTGIGIGKNKIDSIFHAFQQEDGSTSRKYGGTGLGLSISRELAALLGGTLEAESTFGQGSVFTLRLPEGIDDTESEATAESVEVAPVPIAIEETVATPDVAPKDKEYISDDRSEITKSTNSILIIEDDPVFAKILRDTAREKGFMTLVAESGEIGLYLTDLYKPDGIILDMGLPGMDGKTVLFRLKDNLDTRHIPVHIVSANDKTLEPMRMGAVGYLTKPVTMEAMDDAFNRIERVISKELKKVLVVEDNKVMRQEIADLISSGSVEATTAVTGAEAKLFLEKESFDCIILDLSLPDMTGNELLKELNRDEDFNTPVIIHTARELTSVERQALDSLAGSIIVKNAKSMDKLLDDSSLFLHRVAADLPEAKKEMIARLHDREAILENKKVLIVDDDMRNVFSLVSILEDKGINTVVAENGKVALARLQENPDTDLILMDIMMPEMDGYEAMQEIRKMDSKVNKVGIIALTAKAMKGDRAKCIEAGANDYLSKPVDADKLFSMLRVWLY